MFEDNQKKLYLIVNRTLEPALQMNAVGHLAAGIMQKAEETLFHAYPHQETGMSAFLSHYPVVILQAKNSSQLSTAVRKCHEAGLLYNFFTTTMFGHSSEQQIEATKTAALADLTFVAIAIYGDTEKIAPITRKFSLFK
ncbi:DUF2000 domain-containing protein [Mixta gaviniae]|uniref:DUF2000 domain-containing protein n=2 Tax=Mixta gaviniae TaxID=665914 RepID=A0A1X1E507_9GAMM|nr:DUF2000 domain-containing protein [Mixta gaviniae]ORM84025.1 hypothetical protein HA44_05425 [Mixta gaviniae]